MQKKVPGKSVECLFHVLVPGGTLQSRNLWIQEAGQVEKKDQEIL